MVRTILNTLVCHAVDGNIFVFMRYFNGLKFKDVGLEIGGWRMKSAYIRTADLVLFQASNAILQKLSSTVCNVFYSFVMVFMFVIPVFVGREGRRCRQDLQFIPNSDLTAVHFSLCAPHFLRWFRHAVDINIVVFMRDFYGLKLYRDNNLGLGHASFL